MSTLKRLCSWLLLLGVLCLPHWSVAATAGRVTIAVLGMEIKDAEPIPRADLADSIAVFLSDYGDVMGMSTWRVEALTGRSFTSIGDVLHCSECIGLIGESAGAEWLVGGWVSGLGLPSEAGMWLVSVDKPAQLKTLSIDGAGDTRMMLRQLSTQAGRYITGDGKRGSTLKWVKYAAGAAGVVTLALVLNGRGVFDGGDRKPRGTLPRPPDRP